MAVLLSPCRTCAKLLKDRAESVKRGTLPGMRRFPGQQWSEAEWVLG